MLNLQDLKAVWKHDDTSSSKDTWNDSGFFQWPSVWTPQEDNWTPTRKKKPYVRLFNQPCSTFSDRQEATQEPNDEDWFDLIMAQCLLDASNLDEEESFQEETKADQTLETEEHKHYCWPWIDPPLSLDFRWTLSNWLNSLPAKRPSQITSQSFPCFLPGHQPTYTSTPIDDYKIPMVFHYSNHKNFNKGVNRRNLIELTDWSTQQSGRRDICHFKNDRLPIL